MEVATIDGAALPSSRPRVAETLDETAIRVIQEATQDDPHYLEQLYTFSPIQGGPRQIVISYLGLVAAGRRVSPTPDTLVWESVDEARVPDELERMVLEYALVRLRAKLGYTNIAFYLLPATFTLSELQQAYERILHQPMDKRNFRRRMIASGLLIDTGEKRREGSHRPAALYRIREQDDEASYLTPPLVVR
ncbi:MAG TPA: hypothetical protein VNZ58_15405 [Thermomicrobiales bacterium]|nr:hypothetical protein [Thermomicrobiales bacterium]